MVLHKDEILDRLARQGNVAQFVSFRPGRDGLPFQSFSRVAGHDPNQPFFDARECIEALLASSGERKVNMAAELTEKRARTTQHMHNTFFYAVKLTYQDSVIHAVTKADASWKTKSTQNKISVFFNGEQLGLETNPAFSISRGVDFFIAGDDIVILDRDNFESVLNYKAAHAQDFLALQAEPAFVGIFVDQQPLIDFVGTNKLHLRRACAIRHKGLYQDPQYMVRLRQNFGNAGLNLTFDPQGRILATADQCPDIIRALLDHRLHSLFSEHFFDVQSATAVT